MKILMVVDKKGSAIDRLAEGVKKYLPHMHIDIIDVHPKRPSPEQLQDFKRLAQEADILDFEYWKTYVMLREEFPELMDKPKILAHYNPYNIFEEKWEEFNIITVPNRSIEKQLQKNKKVKYIPLTIDLDKFRFNREYTEDKNVLMVTSRIESKKGCLNVARACKKLGYKFTVVGSISDKEYFDEMINEGAIYKERITDEELVKTYYDSAILVCNSIDDYESGTLPILEAMATGVPVVTRNIGHVPELFNGKNLIVRDGEVQDEEQICLELKNLMEDYDKRKEMREVAWSSVKVRDDIRRARQYEKMYYSLQYTNKLVSVIVPTYNRKNTLIKVIESIIVQDYAAIELIIVDDGSSDGTNEMIQELSTRVDYTIKYINTNTPDEYNLALARNLGAIEAVGGILVFVDDRYYLDKDCISCFVENLYPKNWLHGNKGNSKTSFIENFSCIFRDNFFSAGMFNTSVKSYGFLTQETRERFKRQGFEFKYIDEAKAETILSSKTKYRKKAEIIKSKNILYKMDF